MMTIVSHLTIKRGHEPAWDAALRERIAAAREQPGFVAVQLCAPIEKMSERLIIGTWETRADWEAWHNTQPFEDTRRKLEQPDTKMRREWWHEVIVEEHR
jgi:heme-degrading monooxygenase HmoA